MCPRAPLIRTGARTAMARGSLPTQDGTCVTGTMAGFQGQQRGQSFRSPRCRPYTYRVGEVAERLKAAVC
jgi:hypothetical protein